MSAAAPRPPAVSRRVLGWASRRLGTPELADDAAELFVDRSRREGERRARRWYRRQAVAALGQALFPRRGRRGEGMGGGAWGAAAGRTGIGRGRSPLPDGRTSSVSLLDFKLGLRMLVKYPGLTVVAGVAMAFAIAVGAVTFEFARDAMYPTLPIEDGDRVVRIHQVDRRVRERVGVPPAEFRTWREALRTIDDPGAFHRFAGNLWLGDEEVVAVDGVAVSPSAFGLSGEAPLLGRVLVEGDEDPGAPPVVVLGHDLWRSRFSADPAVVGRVVRLGDEGATVVGVVPDRFAFPAPADLYRPVRLDALAARAAAGERVPAVTGFGRLAPGATMEEARAELAILAAATATGAADEREQVVADVQPFAYPLLTTSAILTNILFALAAVLLVMLMVVVCANVALLLFARAATREGEMAVRSALGASRGRIVGQLFVEALVLAGVATAVGLLAAAGGLKRAMHIMRANPTDTTPFWIGDTLSPATIGWAVLLALLGAAIAGVSPGLQVTRRGVNAKLQSGAGRGSGLRIGGLWTGVVVAQVALTVLFIPVVLTIGSVYWKVRTAERPVAAEQYLVARFESGGDPARFEEARRELRARLAGEPWVRGVTMADGIWPGWSDTPLEVEGLPAPADPRDAPRSQHMEIDAAFFDVMEAPLIAGRRLAAEDVDAGRQVVVVDETFVREVLGGQNAVGRRIRFGGGPAAAAGEAPWHEIVGVVGDLGLNPFAELPSRAVTYWPLPAEGLGRVGVIVHVAGDPASFANGLRVLAIEADPTARLEPPLPLAYRMDRPAAEYGAWFRVLATAGGLALLLTLAGIYAVMAFTVARRTREIGVRVALGADRRRIARTVLARAASHVAYGILAGGAVIPMLMLAVARAVNEDGPGLWPPIPVVAAILALYLAVMMTACMLACVVPLRRALRVHPVEALAAEV